LNSPRLNPARPITWHQGAGIVEHLDVVRVGVGHEQAPARGVARQTGGALQQAGTERAPSGTAVATEHEHGAEVSVG
jgi:hypothetical protein